MLSETDEIHRLFNCEITVNEIHIYDVAAYNCMVL